MRYLILPLLSTLLILAPACEKGPSNEPQDETASPAEASQDENAETPAEPPSATDQAEQAIQENEEASTYEPEGGVYAPLDYLTVVMRTPGQARLAVSKANMRTLGQAITLHKMTQSGFPDSLDTMAKKGEISPKLLNSPGNPKASLVYLKPTDRPSSKALLAFDPVGYRGNTFVILTCGGGSKTMELDELKAAIRAREGKVVKPELRLER